MTLKDLLLQRIAANGPLTVAEFMAECLMHPTYGYYSTHEPFGAQGDFITAPETSQMFGEVIGLCLAQTWIDQGRPAPFALAELGPGRGTLMADILRACGKIPGFLDAMDLHLVETSARLRALQRETLAGFDITFHETPATLPQQALFAVANEFFDALPVRQFVRTDTGWRERQVGCEGDALTFGLSPELPQPALDARKADTQPGDLVEYAPAAAPIIAALSERIEAEGGAALIIDYGDWRSLGDTLQAVHMHETTDVLSTPGECDVTAHVDFEALTLASTAGFTKLTPQGVFLERLGITQRAQALAAQLSGDTLDQHIQAHRRLTHPAEMGNLFKVLGLFPSGNTPPVGLDT